VGRWAGLSKKKGHPLPQTYVARELYEIITVNDPELAA
jgi:hypothetical protein